MSVVDVLPGVLAVGVIGVLVFVFFWLSNKTKHLKEVLFFRPRDKRGEVLDITRETDRSVACERSNPVHRFIKIGAGFTFKDRGKTVTRFLGIEGSAYTAPLNLTKDVIKVSVEDFLRGIWGNKVYDYMPKKMRDAVEKDKIGITIEPVKINPADYGLEALSSDEVNDESDAVVLDRLSKFGSSENIKTKMLQNLIWVALGFALAIIISKFVGF